MAWDHGYASDVPYTSGFYKDLAPSHQALAALMAGVLPPDPKAPYRYLELGCGTGVGLAVLAAANPHAEFVGVDFMPAHVAAARRLIARAGLSNIEVVEADFTELADGPRDLGQFQFAGLHGVYTWVSAEVRAAAVRLLGRCLAPGGLLYVGYNSTPGWRGMISGQRLLLEQARRGKGDSPARMLEALKVLERLRDAKAAGLETRILDNQVKAGGGVDKLSRAMLVYLCHEYLNEHWAPIHVTELARDLAEAKLEFAGRSELLQTLPELVLTADQRAALRDIYDPLAAELQVDLLAPMPFRRDIFVRGAHRISQDRRTALLREIEIALLVAPEDVPMSVPLPVVDAKLDLDEEVYAPIVRRLAEGPATVGELVDMTTRQGGVLSAVELLVILAGSGAAAPVVAPAAAPETVRDFNLALVDVYREQAALRFSLACGLTGGGVDTPLPNCLAYKVAAGRREGLEAMDMAELETFASDNGELWRGLRML